MKWIRKAADQGYASAQLNLGLSYDKGHGVTQDLAQAVEWYRKAAEHGLAEAQYNLGGCYYFGVGVPVLAMNDDDNPLLGHSFSIYDLRMNNLTNSKGEDLFKVILGMDRTVVDNHIEWKQRSLRELQKAFIIGRTIANETPNLEGVLFNESVKGGRENVFMFGIEAANKRLVIVIHRLDSHLKAIFRGPLPTLYEINPLEKARWNDPVKREELRNRIVSLLTLPTATIQRKISERTSHCIGEYARSCETAELAYALMLAQTAHKDVSELRKFVSNDENLFGDTGLVQEALILGATILTNDRHVRKMASYCQILCSK